MQVKLLTTYSADAGTCVINGIGFDNGVGDGTFPVYYAQEKPDYAMEVPGVWIDLRNGYPIIIHGYDCDVKGEEQFGQKVLNRDDFPGADALRIAVWDGNIYLFKYF